MEEKTFEDALKRIEKIVSSLEEADLPLKNRIEEFKEGAGLLKFCEKELKEAELKEGDELEGEAKKGEIKLRRR